MRLKYQMRETTKRRAALLYLDICRLYARNENEVGLSVRDVAKLMGTERRNSTGLAAHYLKLLQSWGLVTWESGIVCSIRPLELPNYPPVFYVEADHADES